MFRCLDGVWAIISRDCTQYRWGLSKRDGDMEVKMSERARESREKGYFSWRGEMQREIVKRK